MLRIFVAQENTISEMIPEHEFEQDYYAIIDRLKEKRVERGLTPYALAKRAGLSAPAVTNIENKTKRASLMSIIRISRVLGVML